MAKNKQSGILLDASALIAVVLDEPGARRVEEYVEKGVSISSVNLAETISKLMYYGYTESELEEMVTESQINIVPFTREHALLMPLFQPYVKSHNLSLADRACLAVAKERNYAVATTDKTFSTLPLALEVRLIR